MYEEDVKQSNKMVKFLKDWLIPIICALVIAFLIRKFVLFKVEVPTGSMLPTVELNDQIFVTKVYSNKQIKRGDIVVFERPGEKYYLLKRVIGMPGDNIEIKENGEVYINNNKLEERYIGSYDNFSGNFEVPNGEYFMLGDNRAKSGDSREWNYPYIPFKDIKGKTWLRVYPLNRFGLLNRNTK